MSKKDAVTTAGGVPIREVSHWFAQLDETEPDDLCRRPPLSGSRGADVCIVGAGFTGLWTAYELLRASPSLEVVVLEAEFTGYGASGRNGGAVIAQLNGSRSYWDAKGGPGAAVRMERAIQAAVDEVGRAIKREGILCGFAKGGVLVAARNELEAMRLRASVEADRDAGFGPEDSAFLDAKEANKRIGVDHLVGARYSPHSASIHPGALVRGLGRAVERLGATIHEGTIVSGIEPHVAHTAYGDVKADFVVRATEAYSQSLQSDRRRVIPVRTSMLATEPLDDSMWEALGWNERETLLALHPFLHLQHTSDRRITIGGADNRFPYRLGSRPCSDGPANPAVTRFYEQQLARLFPALRGARTERSWHGVFGVSRDWAPGVGFDRDTGLAWAGGYVGEGVAASNLAGRTLSDLLNGRDTDLTHLPWVGVAPRRWEPEPLRGIGAGAIWGVRAIGEAIESRQDRRSRLVALANRLSGFTGHLG
ncbi:MAG: NAD(P)/FAD-dependent oxidoreductase [Acidimicrobiales bacterium]